MKTKRLTHAASRKTGVTKVTARKTRARGAIATAKPATAAKAKQAGKRTAAAPKRRATPRPRSPSRLANAAGMLGALAGKVAAVADRLPWGKSDTATSSSKAPKNTTG